MFQHLIKSQFVCVCVCAHAHMRALSHVKLFATPWTVVHQASLSMALFRQECWSRLPFPPPGRSSWPRNRTLVSHVSCIAGRFFTYWAIKEALIKNQFSKDILAVTHHHTLDLSLSVKGSEKTGFGNYKVSFSQTTLFWADVMENWGPRFYKNWIGIKDNNRIIVGDLSTPLSAMDRLSRGKKSTRKQQIWTSLWAQMDQTNICRASYNNSRIYILLTCIWNILQDKLYVRPQNTS